MTARRIRFFPLLVPLVVLCIFAIYFHSNRTRAICQNVTSDGVDDPKSDTDEWGINWVLIPEGTFLMGCSKDDSDCTQWERPAHQVTVSEFFITRFEITQKQFELVMGYNPTSFDLCPDCAADGLGLREAEEFCARVNAILPTEAQWEYAARGGTSTRYYCGDDEACLPDIAWYSYNSDGRPHVVGLKEPNAFGLYDVLGNVHEYVSDHFGPYTDDPQFDPLGPDNRQWSPLRGAGWASPAAGLRVSYRHAPDPFPYSVDGVRCAKWPLDRWD